jgi:hypothetical protein
MSKVRKNKKHLNFTNRVQRKKKSNYKFIHLILNEKFIQLNIFSLFNSFYIIFFISCLFSFLTFFTLGKSKLYAKCIRFWGGGGRE